MSFLDQIRHLWGVPGVNQQVLLEELMKSNKDDAEKLVTKPGASIGDIAAMAAQLEAEKKYLQAAQARAMQKVLAQQAQDLQAKYSKYSNAIGGIYGAYAQEQAQGQTAYQKQMQAMLEAKTTHPQYFDMAQAQAQVKGYAYESLLISEWADPPAKKTIDDLNTVDEEAMPKKKNPLAQQVAKMTKPVKKIIEPSLDPEPSLEFMLVRQAKDKMLAARKDWTVAQQNQVSVLNTQLTRLQAWNIVWTALSDLGGEVSLDPWLIKRVFQVCDNVLDPSLSPVQVDSILNPKPELMAKPAPLPPVNPFDREFS